MAPEVLLKEPTTFASDVYAWAVTVNELATGVFPFADCTKDNPQCQTILNFGYGRCCTHSAGLPATVTPFACRMCKQLLSPPGKLLLQYQLLAMARQP